MFSSLYKLTACSNPSSPVGLFDRIDEPSGVVQLVRRGDGGSHATRRCVRTIRLIEAGILA